MTVIRSRVPYWCFGYRPPPTLVLEPWVVRDPDIVVQTRKDENEKKKQAAQLPNKVLAAIYGHLDGHPDASNNKIAMWVKRDPETGPLVAHLKHKTLADKIGALRSR
jgi:hypothetical protein